MEKDLKPCPFCGGKVKFIDSFFGGNDVIGIHCKKCKTEVQFCNRKEEIIHGEKPILKKWNKRK